LLETKGQKERWSDLLAKHIGPTEAEEIRSMSMYSRLPRSVKQSPRVNVRMRRDRVLHDPHDRFVCAQRNYLHAWSKLGFVFELSGSKTLISPDTRPKQSGRPQLSSGLFAPRHAVSNIIFSVQESPGSVLTASSSRHH
jgi:hypothetical protein